MPTGVYKRGKRKPMSQEQKDKISIANSGRRNGMYRHGDKGTLLHTRWIKIRHRCKTKEEYKKVKVCGRWENYENFKEDMGEEFYKHVAKFGIKNTSIDRIDNDKGYNKKNCRWATCGEQSNNRKITLKFDGKTIREISEETNTPYRRLFNRLVIYKWPIDKAISYEKHRRCEKN